MGTRNHTLTGFFLRKRLKRHLVLRLWDLIRDVIVGRELAAVWQATVPCQHCHGQIERLATFCSYCGAPQSLGTQWGSTAPPRYAHPVAAPTGGRRRPQTERLPIPPLVPPVRETEEIVRLCDIETKQLYGIRLGEQRPLKQYLAEKHKREAEQRHGNK